MPFFFVSAAEYYFEVRFFFSLTSSSRIDPYSTAVPGQSVHSYCCNRRESRPVMPTPIYLQPMLRAFTLRHRAVQQWRKKTNLGDAPGLRRYHYIHHTYRKKYFLNNEINYSLGGTNERQQTKRQQTRTSPQTTASNLVSCQLPSVVGYTRYHLPGTYFQSSSILHLKQL